MFHSNEPKQNRIDDDFWGKLGDILSESGIEGGFIMDDIIGDISRGGTAGKAKPLRPNGHGSGICNAIPSDTKGSCHRLLWVRCYNRDNLSDRLRDMIYHVSLYCPDDNREVIFITTKWDNEVFKPHQKAVKLLQQNGVRFAFVLCSDAGLTRLPV
jgi:hypothetical protein